MLPESVGGPTGNNSCYPADTDVKWIKVGKDSVESSKTLDSQMFRWTCKMFSRRNVNTKICNWPDKLESITITHQCEWSTSRIITLTVTFNIFVYNYYNNNRQFNNCLRSNAVGHRVQTELEFEPATQVQLAYQRRVITWSLSLRRRRFQRLI